MDTPPAAPAFASPMAELRVERGLEQQEVADRAGLSVRTLRDIEQGVVTRPRARTVKLLAEFYGLPVAEVVLKCRAGTPARRPELAEAA